MVTILLPQIPLVQRELYYPTTLYNWLYKRTVGAMYNVTVKRDWAKVVSARVSANSEQMNSASSKTAQRLYPIFLNLH